MKEEQMSGEAPVKDSGTPAKYSPAGHRKRLQDRYREHGLEAFSETEALEFLLFFGRPRVDTKPIARELLNRFHGLRGVLDSELSDLMCVSGVGEQSAMLITLVSALHRRYESMARQEQKQILDTTSACAYLKPVFLHLKQEAVFMVCLDNSNKVIHCHNLGQGSVNNVNLEIRNLVKLAIQENAAAVILAHNHPSGIALPSKADLSTTADVYKALKYVGVLLLDHLIYSEGDFVSLRDSGYLEHLL